MELSIVDDCERLPSVLLTSKIDYTSVPLRALNITCRRLLSIKLLPIQPVPTSAGITRDWQGLGELAFLSYAMIRVFSQRSDPVADLLDFWADAPYNPTFKDLLENLEKMERYDVIDDLIALIDRDAQIYLYNQKKEKNQKSLENPIQDSNVSSAIQRTIVSLDEGRYDAYVSFHDSDFDFVSVLMAELEGKYKLKLYIKDRDQLFGVVQSEADLEMINERCEKIILIVSENSIKSSHCEFHAIVAQANTFNGDLYSRKVIPIMCKPCELPPRFRYLSKLDYEKISLFENFWLRLACSIKIELRPQLMRTASVKSLENASKYGLSLLFNSNTVASASSTSSSSLNEQQQLLDTNTEVNNNQNLQTDSLISNQMLKRLHSSTESMENLEMKTISHQTASSTKEKSVRGNARKTKKRFTVWLRKNTTSPQ